jgi:CDP-4-dehydro-6-deoxyglucose reductase, E1
MINLKLYSKINMLKKKVNHPLMHNNIMQSDLNEIIKFLKNKPILTQNKKVKKFEEQWSKWLGVKYSIFVNSGSSANFLTIASLKNFTKKKEIIVPALTWISDIVAVVQNGFKPIFIDIDLKNLSMAEDQILKKINKNTAAVFITHAQGFNGLTSKILKNLKDKKIFLIEDVCESHGAEFNNKKLGTYGFASNFSFYYAHHLTTIEGGMICTNDKKFSEIVRMYRSHGMLREAGNLSFEKSQIKKNPMLSPKFIFMYPGFNMRNNEISAVIGINQLKRLDPNNAKRKKNFKYFVSKLDKKIYFNQFQLAGSCNYAFPIILNRASFILRNRLENLMKQHFIEFRRGNAGGGNQLRQPYIKKYRPKNFKNFKNVEHVHSFGYYIGNYPDLSLRRIDEILKILNSLK